MLRSRLFFVLGTLAMAIACGARTNTDLFQEGSGGAAASSGVSGAAGSLGGQGAVGGSFGGHAGTVSGGFAGVAATGGFAGGGAIGGNFAGFGGAVSGGFAGGGAIGGNFAGFAGSIGGFAGTGNVGAFAGFGGSAGSVIGGFGGVAGSPFGGAAGIAGVGGIAQTCADNAPNACSKCLCLNCLGPVTSCLTDPSCVGLLLCVTAAGCQDLACVVKSCGPEIMQAGGFGGPGVQEVFQILTCSLNSGCGC
jgi:hypothetical protein